MIAADGLSKTYARKGMAPLIAVQPTTLTVPAGEIFSLLGPNGAGKTTLISMICGLARPTAGDARIGGHSITQTPVAAKRLLGVVPQEIALYDQLSARRNLEFFGKLQGLNGADLAHHVDEVLDYVDLRERQKEPIKTFSGGMKRRVNLAVGLLHNPQLLFLDEPTVGIDPQNRRRILDTVMRLRAERGMTIFYTSHLMEEVQEISDRVAIMDNGEVIAQGTVGELIQSVGEQDRLIFTTGNQTVGEAIIDALRTEDVTTVEYVAPAIANGTGSEESAAPGEGRLVVRARRGRRALPHLLMRINDAGIEVHSIEVQEPDLEAVFLSLTGKQLRD